MDEYQVSTWHGWHHHIALSLLAVWFLIGETHRDQQLTPALPLPQVRYGLSLLLMEVLCTPGIAYICRQVHRQLMRNELAIFYPYIALVNVCHRVSYVYRYSRFDEADTVLLPEGLKALKRIGKQSGLSFKGACLNLDGGFDSASNRKAIFNAGLIPNVKENPRNCKRPKRGRKRLFNQAIHDLRDRVGDVCLGGQVQAVVGAV
jgi:hypothetical protein